MGNSVQQCHNRGQWVDTWSAHINSLRPRRNRRYNADNIFKCIFLKENVWIPTKISLKFVSKGPINNIPALVQIMAWRRPGDKPLSEPMMMSLLTHICVTQPQWVNIVPCMLLAFNAAKTIEEYVDQYYCYTSFRHSGSTCVSRVLFNDTFVISLFRSYWATDNEIIKWWDIRCPFTEIGPG